MNLKQACLTTFCAVSLLIAAFASLAQGTAFLYQGQLSNGASPANGTYNFQFSLYTAQTNGVLAGGPLTNLNVAVNNGLFTTTLDFGSSVFDGQNLWLQIGVCTNSVTNFTLLSPLQPVLPTPYAIFANSAGNLTGVLPASQIGGTLPASAFAGYTNTVALTNGANLFSGAFNGNGAAITNVNVTNITGVLADSQLPTNTAFLNSNQVFTANNTFNGSNVFTNLYGNSFSGSFFGNGLVGWIVESGTSVTSSIDHGYLLTNSQLVTVTLPATANPGDIVRIACASTTGWELKQNSGQSVFGNFLSYAQTWRQTYANALNWTSIALSSDGTRWIASGYSSGIYVSENSGQTWSPLSDAYAWTHVASSSDGTRLAAVANDNGVWISTNSGTTWAIAVATNLPVPGLASSSSGNNLVAAVNGGAVLVSANGGVTWTVGANTTGKSWNAVASSATGNEMYAAYNGGIYSSSTSGSSWASMGAPSEDWVAIACSSDGSDVIAAATNGAVYLYSGSGWSEASLPTAAAWSGVAMSSDGSKMVAVVNGGDIYTSANWGSTWQTNATTAHWTCVASSSDGSTLVAGIDNTLTTSGSYGLYSGASSSITTSTVSTGHVIGGPASAVELQYIGNNQFMPVSVSGTLWAQ